MQMLWFWLVSVMVAIYAVMDGFDFGAGVLHLWVARTDKERRGVLGAIGPLWDGNEVWLLAGGGILFFAFPKVLAAGFSGFYLAMFMVVWSLLLRGIAIEFRSHVKDSMWRSFWDLVFFGSSCLLPILLGAALGNVVRGVPIDDTGYFNIPLFTSFGTSTPVGVLDWYTVLMGVFVLLTLAGHGATFLAWKTDGPVHERSVWLGKRLWGGVIVLWAVATWATNVVNPVLFTGWRNSALAWVSSAVFVTGLVLVFYGLAKGRHLLSFLGSGAFVLGILATTAASLWPMMLRSTLDLSWSLTALNSSSSPEGLKTGLAWWLIGFPLVIGYFAMLFRIHRGKIKIEDDGY